MQPNTQHDIMTTKHKPHCYCYCYVSLQSYDSRHVKAHSFVIIIIIIIIIIKQRRSESGGVWRLRSASGDSLTLQFQICAKSVATSNNCHTKAFLERTISEWWRCLENW